MNLIRNLFGVVMLFSLPSLLFSQSTYLPDVDLNYSANKLNARGITDNGALSVDGNEIIGEFDGNLHLVHSMNYKLPNGLDVIATLNYNANVEHRLFSYVEEVIDGFTNEGYMVNAPEWIIGINGFAVQTLNFENNFYLPDIAYNLKGEQCPLLIPGYNYTERFQRYASYLDPVGKNSYDYIHILMADGSKKTLSNVKLCTTNADDSRIGTYVDPGKGPGSDGYAIVEYISGTNPKLRKMWYKPGDGLTYYFEEENVKYKSIYLTSPDKEVKVMYLKKIIASNGAYIYLGYDDKFPNFLPSSWNYINIIYGRKFFDYATYVYNGKSTYVIGLNFRAENDYVKSFEMATTKGFGYLKGSISNFNSGSKFISTDRDSTHIFSKIKYLERIEDKIGRTNIINYHIYTNRNYRWVGNPVERNFTFNHPIYLIDTLNYYSGKVSTFEFYNKSFGIPPDCGNDYYYIDFSHPFPENGCNIGWAGRDNQTNFMIKNRAVSNKIDGVIEQVFSENYSYELIPHDSQNPDWVRTKNLFTTIVKQNLVPGDTTAPETITRVLNFTKFKFQNYDATFEQYTGLGGSISYSEILKLVDEKLISGADTLKKKYIYDIDSTRGFSISVNGSHQLDTLKEQLNNLPEKITTYSYLYEPKSIAHNKALPNSGTFLSTKNIVKQIIKTDPTGISQETNYSTSFFNYQNSSLDAFYDINSLSSKIEYSGSSTKSKRTYDYYQGLPEGIGKIKWSKDLDPFIMGRERELQYSYNIDGSIYSGCISNYSLDNGLQRNFSYPFTDVNYPDLVSCKWVKFDDSIIFTPNHRFYEYPDFENQPHRIQTILNLDTLEFYQSNRYGYIYMVDENGYVNETILDNIGRLKEVNLPGSYTYIPEDWDWDLPVSNNSKIYYYNNNPNHMSETVRFNNNPVQISNMVTLSEYDGLGQLSDFSVEKGQITYELKQSKKYNYLGLVSEETDGTGITTRYKYDYLGRPIIINYSDGTKDLIEYIATSGTVDGKSYYEYTKFTDASGKIKKTYYDIGGNIVAEKVGTYVATKFNYNSIGQLTSTSSPMGKVTTYQYDGFGNISERTSPDEGTTKYKYDKWGNLRFSLNPASPSTAKELSFNKYDQLGRLVITGLLAANYGFDVLNPDLDYSTAQSGKGPFENYITNQTNFVLVNMYDNYTRTGVFANLPNFAAGTLQNLKGKLVATAFRESTNAWSYKIYSYDYLGRIKDEYIFFQSTSVNKKITNEYDKLDNLVKQNMDDQFYTWYEYDELNRLTTVKSNNSDSNPKLEAIYYYSPSDKITNLELGFWGSMAPRLHYLYDTKGRIYDIDGIATDVFSTSFKETLTFYNNDNVQTMFLKNLASDWPNLNFTFTYDDKNRLSSSTCSNSAYNENYFYDNDSNFDSKLRPYNVSQNLTYTYGITGTNKLTHLTKGTSLNFDFLYDHNGNLKTDPRKAITNITYDRRNLQYYTYVNSALKYGFFYDDAGNRICKKQLNPTAQEYYLRDHTGRELAVYDWVTKKLKFVNLYGVGLIGRVNVSYDANNNRTDTRQYYFKDHLGSIRQVIDGGGTFDIIGAQDYYPYGEILRQYTTGSNVNDKYKFTEKERDTETNYDYFGARYYDSQIGRWLQVDPLAEKYPGWSPYNYTLNNPLKHIDPDGKGPFDFAVALTNHLISKLSTIVSGFNSSKVVTDKMGNTVSGGAVLKDWGNKIGSGLNESRKDAVRYIDKMEDANSKIQITTDITRLGIPVPKLAGKIGNINKASNIVTIGLSGAKFILDPNTKNFGGVIIEGVTFGGAEALGKYLGNLDPETYEVVTTYLDPVIDAVGWSTKKLVETYADKDDDKKENK